MGFMSRLRSLLPYGRAVFGYSLDSPQPVHQDADTTKLIEAFAGVVYVCASRNSTRVASQPLCLYATTGEGQAQLRCKNRPLVGKELANIRKALRPELKQAEVAEVLQHPVLDLLNYVNEIQGRFELFELTELGQELTGNSYWWLRPDALGVPKEILVLPPQLITIKLSPENLIGSYVFGTNPATAVTIPAEQVIHFRFPNPDGKVYGYGPAEAAWGSVLDLRSMQRYERALNNNMGVPSLFIQYEGTVEKAELARIEADWNRKLRGIDKSGRAHVGDSKFKVQPIGLSPRDMSFREGRKWTRLEIANCFGVPIDLIDTENSNRATADQANYQYEAFTIKPRLTRIADKLNERLVPFYDDRLFFQYEENVPADTAGLLAETVGLKNAGIITVDEARERYDLPPMPAEDEPEEAEPTPAPGAADEEPDQA
jgi:HK97 family phage portal protein